MGGKKKKNPGIKINTHSSFCCRYLCRSYWQCDWTLFHTGTWSRAATACSKVTVQCQGGVMGGFSILWPPPEVALAVSHIPGDLFECIICHFWPGWWGRKDFGATLCGITTEYCWHFLYFRMLSDCSYMADVLCHRQKRLGIMCSHSGTPLKGPSAVGISLGSLGSGLFWLGGVILTPRRWSLGVKPSASTVYDSWLFCEDGRRADWQRSSVTAASRYHCSVRYWNLTAQIVLSHFDIVWQFMLCRFFFVCSPDLTD